MRYYPAALALSLLAAVTASASQAQVAAPLDPRAAALLREGQGDLARGDVAGATDAFETALAIAPGAVPVYVALGDAARRAALPGKAIHYYRLALAADPNNRAGLAGEGGAMAEKGALDKARRNLARLEGLCGKTCPEADGLNAAIAKGPLPKVVTADAVKPDPVIGAN